MLRHNFPPGYYEYHGADPPSSSTSSTYYGMQYRVSVQCPLSTALL